MFLANEQVSTDLDTAAATQGLSYLPRRETPKCKPDPLKRARLPQGESYHSDGNYS